MKFAKIAALVLALAGVGAQAALVTTNVYSGHSGSGDGTPFSGLVGTLETSDINFATTTGYNWHPFGLGGFGSESLAQIMVGVEGDYTFALDSDDGSSAFIDGVKFIDNGGGHGPNTVLGTIHLSAGVHDLRVNFFEDFGGASGLDFRLAQGVRYIDSNGNRTPEPFGLALVGAALGGLGLVRRRKA